MEDCTICAQVQKGPTDPHLIFETDYFRITLHEDQSYLGRSIIIAKRHIESDSGVTAAEAGDYFIGARSRLEHIVKMAFGASKTNCATMMNKDPHFHAHYRPRYDKDVLFAGHVFTDQDYGKHYDPNRKTQLSEEQRQAILNEMRRYIAL